MAPGKQQPLAGGTRVVQSRRQVWSDLEDEVAILQVEKGVYYGLNPVGARIWHLLEQERTVAELCTILEAEYEVKPDVLAKDIDTLVRRLRRAGLVEVQ
jgi:hypothetical protein